MSDLPNTQAAVDRLLTAANTGSSLDGVDPYTFVNILIDVVPSLASEFPSVDLKIDSGAVPFFCDVLRRGQLERTVTDGVAKNIPEAQMRAQVDPGEFTLPKRIEHYAMFHKAVEMRMPSDMARLMVADLSAGLAKMPKMPEQSATPEDRS